MQTSLRIDESGSHAPSKLATATAATLATTVARLGRYPALLAGLLLATLLAGAAALPGLEWNDDLRSLSAVDPALEDEDRRVRARVSPFDPGRAVVALAEGDEAALVLNDRVHERLSRAIDDGVLAGMGSLHAFLWSGDLQRRNWESLTADQETGARVDRVFGAAGFRPGAFRPFSEALAGPAPEVLSLDALRASPLGTLVGPQVLDVGGRTGIVTLLRGVRSAPALESALAGMPDVHVLDQGAFVNSVYGTFRSRTLRQAALGSLLVVAVLLARYRRLRPTLAAFLPSALVAVVMLGAFAATGMEANLIHAVSLMLVMGMGVDYGIFLVDSAGDDEAFRSTLLSLLLSCLTTVFVFGTLALSSQPALRAMGITAGLGVLLSFLFAPLTLLVTRWQR